MLKIEEIKVNSFLTKSKSFGYVFNPYRGCMHQCKYCYAHYMKEYTQHKENWGEYVDVKQINHYTIPKTANNIMLSSVTDPYQPLEARFKVTRKALEHLIDFNGKVSILTKSKLVSRDIDLFKQIKNIEVGMSIATVDEKFRKIMEPNASPINERLSALKEIHKANITTYVFIAPILPKLTNYKKIIEDSKEFVDYYMFDAMRLKGDNKKWVFDELKRYAPSLIPLYHDIYEMHNYQYFEELRRSIESYCKQVGVKYKIFL